MINFRPIDVKTIRQKVYEQLRDLIMTGRIEPGQTLSLRRLAQEFGVSLMPVREAVWKLESEGVLVVESNKRIHVSSLSIKEMEEALRLRFMLESEAARRSCERRPESVIPKMEHQLRDMNAAMTNPRRYIQIGNSFHFTLYSFADSPLLLDLIDKLWARIGPYFYLHVTKSEDLEQTVKYHRDMFAAFKSRDTKKLVEALRADLEDPAKHIIAALKKETS